MLLLVLWIVSIIVADTYVIVVEYVRANLSEQLAQANEQAHEQAAKGDEQHA